MGHCHTILWYSTQPFAMLRDTMLRNAMLLNAMLHNIILPLFDWSPTHFRNHQNQTRVQLKIVLTHVPWIINTQHAAVLAKVYSYKCYARFSITPPPVRFSPPVANSTQTERFPMHPTQRVIILLAESKDEGHPETWTSRTDLLGSGWPPQDVEPPPGFLISNIFTSMPA